jgi:hypothetical protein
MNSGVVLENLGETDDISTLDMRMVFEVSPSSLFENH